MLLVDSGEGETEQGGRGVGRRGGRGRGGQRGKEGDRRDTRPEKERRGKAPSSPEEVPVKQYEEPAQPVSFLPSGVRL